MHSTKPPADVRPNGTPQRSARPESRHIQLGLARRRLQIPADMSVRQLSLTAAIYSSQQQKVAKQALIDAHTGGIAYSTVANSSRRGVPG